MASSDLVPWNRCRDIIAGMAMVTVSIVPAYAQIGTPVSPDEAVKLKAALDAQSVASAPYPQDLMLSDGQVLAPSVPLYDLPANVGVAAAAKLRFARIGDHTVLVDPTDRKIVYLVS